MQSSPILVSIERDGHNDCRACALESGKELKVGLLQKLRLLHAREAHQLHASVWRGKRSGKPGLVRWLGAAHAEGQPALEVHLASNAVHSRRTRHVLVVLASLKVGQGGGAAGGVGHDLQGNGWGMLWRVGIQRFRCRLHPLHRS